MASRIGAIGEVLRRYGQVFRAAWAERRALEPLRRTREELAFLPAHLELADTPLSPVPRRSLWVIMALFCAALLWACVGKLDVVAVAPGKTVTSGRTKVIQSAETAVVRRILVHDGQVVTQGELLIELDATATSADSKKAEEALINARLAALRATALVTAMAAGEPPTMANHAGLPADRFEATQQLAFSQFAAFAAKKQSLQAMVAQKQAELHTVESAIVPLEQYLEISRTRVADYEKLLEKSYVPRQEYLQRKQERINAERDLAGQRSRKAECSPPSSGPARSCR